ncbi:PR domain zinc finger protein 10 [Frankliniella fusca]|uniref:PR domain zinc finger protein 10 n=1 Tax=Frankliniella fusca TaxID=407009 RepID=A0AAE1L821_9NEOP|nr:PR domain zinc finger protein 10 [Frankliniella fusca]
MPVCIKQHSCPSCHKRFSDQDRLRSHLGRAHGSEGSRTIKCNVCFKCFLNTAALGSHLRTHIDQEYPWECLICQETCCSRENLKGHIASHSRNGLFPCPSCVKIFSGYFSLKKHIIKTHKGSGIQCSLCDSFCRDAQTYKKHMLRHSEHKQHPCGHCKKQFTRGDKLKEHIKRVHECELSEEAGKTLEEKLQQRKISSETRIEKKLQDLNAQYLFKCEPCLLGFKRRGMLVNHIAKHHPNITLDEVPELNLPIVTTTRDFFCHLCEKVYKSNAKRKAHIMKFHSEAVKEGKQLTDISFGQPAGTVAKKPERCPWCHKQYAANAKLLQHMRSKHPDKSNDELRKRGKSAVMNTHNIASEHLCEYYDVDKNNSVTSDESSINIDSCGTDMFTTEPDSAEKKERETMPTFTTNEDDELTLAVCLMMSHPDFMQFDAPEEDLPTKDDTLNIDLNQTGACGEVKMLEDSSLTKEDADLLMAEWLVDLQSCPPHSENAFPLIQRGDQLMDELKDNVIFESIQNIQGLLDEGDLKIKPFVEADLDLYDTNLLLTTVQTLPPQIVDCPYPPH